MITNYHSHSLYCDGKASVAVMADAAIASGLNQLGFSSHAPLPFPVRWSLSSEDEILNYIKDIHNARNDKAGIIEIFAGLEADYIPGWTTPFRHLKEGHGLDYLIGSVHLVKVPGTEQVWFIDGKPSFFDDGINKYFQGDGKKAALAYFRQVKEMITSEDFDMIAHFDKIKMNNAGRFFSENDDWYVRETEDVLTLLKERQIILEINTRGFYQNKATGMYPSAGIIKRAAQTGVMMTINSDAHQPHELTLGFDEAKKQLIEAGCHHVYIRKNDAWEATGLSHYLT